MCRRRARSSHSSSSEPRPDEPDDGRGEQAREQRGRRRPRADPGNATAVETSTTGLIAGAERRNVSAAAGENAARDEPPGDRHRAALAARAGRAGDRGDGHGQRRSVRQQRAAGSRAGTNAAIAALIVTPSTRNGIAWTVIATKIVAQCATAGLSSKSCSRGRRAAAATMTATTTPMPRSPSAVRAGARPRGRLRSRQHPPRPPPIRGEPSTALRRPVHQKPKHRSARFESIARRQESRHQGEGTAHGEKASDVWGAQLALAGIAIAVVLAAPLASPNKASGGPIISGARSLSDKIVVKFAAAPPKIDTTDVHLLAFNDLHGTLDPGTNNLYGQFAGGAAFLAKAVKDEAGAVRRPRGDDLRRRQHRRQPARRTGCSTRSRSSSRRT